MSDKTTFDTDLVGALARIVSDTGLTEIEVSRGDLRIRIAKAAQPVAVAVAAPPAAPVAAPVAAALHAAAPPADGKAASAHPGAVPSPMVGTAYLRPTPEAKPFVEVGSAVKAGDKLLLIEAMKTFNEIVAPRGGTVSAILVADGQPVEYGETLFVIE